MPTALITGANRGIGRALAEAYSKRGWTVLTTARKDAAALPGEGFTLDVTDPVSVAALAKSLAGRPIGLLWNNAGVYLDKGKGLGDLAEADFAGSFAANAAAPILLARALADNVAASDQRKMAFISSQMGSIERSGTGAYAYRMSKAALNMGVSLLAKDWRGRGITCAILHPGWVRTDMGGPGADISTDQSVAGMMAVMDRFTLANSGSFLAYDGSPFPW